MSTQRTPIRLLKLVISLIYFSLGELRNVYRALTRRRPIRARTILYYHSVLPGERYDFSRQLDVIQRQALVISLDSIPLFDSALQYVAITFDDGFDNILTNAVPELQARRLPATIFVPTDLLGKYPPWIATSADRDRYGRLMSPDTLKEIQSALISIGSHGMSHSALPQLSQDKARRELFASRRFLEDLLDRKVVLFSFPFGEFSQSLVGWCREAGYEHVFTSSPMNAFSDPDEFVTGRVWAEPSDWKLEFWLKVMGAYSWLPPAISFKRMISRCLLTRARRLDVDLRGPFTTTKGTRF